MDEERHADPDSYADGNPDGHAYGNPDGHADGNPDSDTHGCADPDKSPKTGDGAEPMLWLAALTLCAGGLMMLRRRR